MKHLLIFLLFIPSCVERISDKKVKKYGMEFNEERKRYKIPLLTDKMVLTSNRDNWLTWFAKDKNYDSLAFYSKSIEFKDGKISREFSEIAGAEKYTTVDGRFCEQLIITNEFSEDEILVRTRYFYRFPKNIFGEHISKKAADSLLKLWAIEIY